MAHNDGRDWYGGGWLAVFEQFVETPITPDPSLIGQEVTRNGVVAKLVDESTCFFRRETRPFETAPLVLFGEIHFGPEGYLVIGRLPGSPGDQVVALIVLTFLFAGLIAQTRDLFSLLGLTLLLIFLAGMFLYLFTSEQDNLRKAYLKAIEWVQSGKVSNRLDYFSKDTVLACAICGTTADFVCKHCRQPFCEQHIGYYTTSYETHRGPFPEYWVGYLCADCRKRHEDTGQCRLKVGLGLMALLVIVMTIAITIEYVKDLFFNP